MQLFAIRSYKCTLETWLPSFGQKIDIFQKPDKNLQGSTIIPFSFQDSPNRRPDLDSACLKTSTTFSSTITSQIWVFFPFLKGANLPITFIKPIQTQINLYHYDMLKWTLASKKCTFNMLLTHCFTVKEYRSSWQIVNNKIM